jgi:hypothetical protein
MARSESRFHQIRAGLVRDIDWTLVLVWFMRTVALLWLAKGLWSWAGILGFTGPGLDRLPIETQATLVGFGVADLVAAVGLWLTASWGGVVWLIALAAQCALIIAGPGVLAGAGALAGNAVLAAAYLFLTFQASRAARDD